MHSQLCMLVNSLLAFLPALQMLCQGSPSVPDQNLSRSQAIAVAAQGQLLDITNAFQLHRSSESGLSVSMPSTHQAHMQARPAVHKYQRNATLCNLLEVRPSLPAQPFTFRLCPCSRQRAFL